MSALSSEAALASSTYHPHSLAHPWNQIQTPSLGHNRGRGGVDLAVAFVFVMFMVLLADSAAFLCFKLFEFFTGS
jgi:hypothetical protein